MEFVLYDDALRTFESDLCVWSEDRIERRCGVAMKEKTHFLIVLERSHEAVLVSS